MKLRFFGFTRTRTRFGILEYEYEYEKPPRKSGLEARGTQIAQLQKANEMLRGENWRQLVSSDVLFPMDFQSPMDVELGSLRLPNMMAYDQTLEKESIAPMIHRWNPLMIEKIQVKVIEQKGQGTIKAELLSGSVIQPDWTAGKFISIAPSELVNAAKASVELQLDTHPNR